MKYMQTSVRVTQIQQDIMYIRETLDSINTRLIEQGETLSGLKEKVLNTEKRVDGMQNIIFGAITSSVLALLGILGQWTMYILGKK